MEEEIRDLPNPEDEEEYEDEEYEEDPYDSMTEAEREFEAWWAYKEDDGEARAIDKAIEKGWW